MHNFLKKDIGQKISHLIYESQFIGGPEVRKFEKNFESLVGAQHCISCANGTDALLAATKALGLKLGDEVIVPAMSWVSTSEILSQSGAKPVFCDIDPKTYTLDPSKLTNLITNKTVGIIPVHLYGHPADMVEIMNIAERFGLWVIEDCAQAHLAKFDGRMIGTFGNISTFSFFPGKNFGAMGDAGALITNNEELFNFIFKYVNHGQKEKHLHEFDGINSRMDSIQAGILNIKMPYLDTWTEERRRIANLYNSKLENKKIISKPQEGVNSYHVWHLYSLKVQDPTRFVSYLKRNQISSSRNYPKTLCRLPQYAPRKCVDTFANDLANHVVNIPLCPMMNENEINKVIKVVNGY